MDFILLDSQYNEDKYLEDNVDILNTLLFDHTTKKNIIWATKNYRRKGYKETDHIDSNCLMGRFNPIKSRVEKSKKEQTKRSKDMAEVFTPSSICNKQNNLIDDEWFGYVGAFNTDYETSWIITEKVVFQNGKTWLDYVQDIRLEITCGEAPYLVSRYDAVTGERIPLDKRIGFFDRKIRVINENAQNDDVWIEQSLQALKSIYGFEFQGDNLLIARKNIFFSYIEYFFQRFKHLPDKDLLTKVADIISWNLWQMDGLKMVIPYSCHNVKQEYIQTSLFDDEEEPHEEICPGCRLNDVTKHNGIRCYIMDWENEKKTRFISMMRGSK